MPSHTYPMRGCYPAIITAEASKLFATVVVQWTSGVGVRIPFPPREDERYPNGARPGKHQTDRPHAREARDSEEHRPEAILRPPPRKVHFRREGLRRDKSASIQDRFRRGFCGYSEEEGSARLRRVLFRSNEGQDSTLLVAKNDQNARATTR